jgi:hypothetical protein
MYVGTNVLLRNAPYCISNSSETMVSSPPATEETGAMGREIESRLGIGL